MAPSAMAEELPLLIASHSCPSKSTISYTASVLHGPRDLRLVREFHEFN
jgi:hypothetical protein